MIGTTAALILAGTAAASTAGNIYGAKKAAGAANRAANLQTDAANRAAELQAKSAADTLAFQRDMWNQGQANMAPYLAMGRSALGGLNSITGLGGGGNGGPMGTQPMGRSMWNASGYQAPEMVQMRSPTGEVRAVPKAMVPHYQSRGGQVVA